MPTTSRTRSRQSAQPLHLNISPSAYVSSESFGVARSPPSASATVGSQFQYDPYYSPPTGESSLFSVLCMHEFFSNEDGILPFRQNEILDIVKCDDTGWWAAMRKNGPIVGWIPKGYVTPLSTEMADKLRNISEELRIFEYEAEQLYDSAPVIRAISIFSADSTTISPLFESEDYQTSTSHHVTIQAQRTSTRRDQKTNLSSKSSNNLRRPPPSPSSPMPHPPISRSETELKRSTSFSDADNNRYRGLSRNPSTRPRPVILEDKSTLSRLSTLIESTGNKKDIRANIPDISDSLENISIRGRENRTPQRKGSGSGKKFVPSIIDIKPWYLQLQYANQIDQDDNGRIRSATLPALIERLTTDMAFENLTKLEENKRFTNVFFMTFRTFITAIGLFDILVGRYNISPPKPLKPEEHLDWTEKLLIPTQRRVLEIFSIWLEKHRLLEEEPYIAPKLTEFLKTIHTPPHDSTANQIIKSIERLTFTVPRQPLSVGTPKKARKSKPHRNDLLRLEPSDLAEQLSLLEYNLYAKITPQECVAYAKTQSGSEVANLQEFCSTHDKLGSWVKASILNHDILSKRSDTVDFWIKVAEKCRQLSNFASMSAIIIALSSTVITRLHLTWAHVSRKSTLDALLRHNEPSGGFSGYRALLQNACGPCVPFISMYLTDLVHASEQFTSDGQISFYQRARWYEITTNILKFQHRMYDISATEQTMKFIEERLKEGMGWDPNWFWTKSQEVQHTEVANADIRKGLEEAGF